MLVRSREERNPISGRRPSSLEYLKLAVAGAAKFKPRLVEPLEVIMKSGTVAETEQSSLAVQRWICL